MAKERTIRGRHFSIGDICWYRCMNLKFPRPRRLVVVRGFSSKQDDVILFSPHGCKATSIRRGNADWFKKTKGRSLDAVYQLNAEPMKKKAVKEKK